MSRTTLTKDEAKVFSEWLKSQGWVAQQLQDYEAYRLRKDDRYIILYSRKGKDRLTIPVGIAQDMMMEWLDVLSHEPKTKELANAI